MCIRDRDTTASKPVISIKKDTFVATKSLHEKTTKYAEMYGNITAEGLVFKVQIAAYKYPKNYVYEHLKGLGNVDNFLLDGITPVSYTHLDVYKRQVCVCQSFIGCSLGCY